VKALLEKAAAVAMVRAAMVNFMVTVVACVKLILFGRK
jgi:hypothetical protein